MFPSLVSAFARSRLSVQSSLRLEYPLEGAHSWVGSDCVRKAEVHASVRNCSYALKLPSVWARTAVPFAIAVGDAYSSGRWLIPPRHGMNIIAVRTMRDMNSESWYARLMIG